MSSDADRLAEFPPGASRSTEVELTRELVDQFARLSGDDNPLHMDDEAARARGFARRVVHGALATAFISTLIGKQIPGAGALWRSFDVEWLKPLFIGDRLKLVATVERRSIAAASLALSIAGSNQLGTEVLRARAVVGLNEELAERSGAEVSRSRGTAAGTSIGVSHSQGIAAETSIDVSHSRAPAAETSIDPSNGTLPPSASAARPATAVEPRATGRVALITGASRGIGRAIALELARRGFAVAVAYHENEAAAREVVDSARSGGARATALAIDASVPAHAVRALRTVEAELGAVNALVHAATPPLLMRTFEDCEDALFDNYWRTYVLSAAALVRAMLPAIKATHWGRVVLLGTSALIGPPPAKMSAYVTAKSAVLGLTRALAVELGPLGATVNTVSPGLTATDLVREYSPRTMLAEAQKTPVRRLATPEDTAQLTAFLLSDQAASITGAHLPVNGGLAMST